MGNARPLQTTGVASYLPSQVDRPCLRREEKQMDALTSGWLSEKVLERWRLSWHLGHSHRANRELFCGWWTYSSWPSADHGHQPSKQSDREVGARDGMEQYVGVGQADRGSQRRSKKNRIITQRTRPGVQKRVFPFGWSVLRSTPFLYGFTWGTFCAENHTFRALQASSFQTPHWSCWARPKLGCSRTRRRV